MTSYIEEFEQEIVPKYRNYYVSYKQLLDAIELLKERQSGADSNSGLLKGLILPKDFAFGDTTAMYGLLEQRPEVRFVSLLEHEVSKLNHFTQLEVRTLLSGLRQLHNRLDRIFSGSESVSRRVFPSIVEDGDLCLSVPEQLLAVYDRLVSQSKEILVLQDYIRINVDMFNKLAIEFDSTFSDRPPVAPWFLANLVDEPFSNIPFASLFSLIVRLYKQCMPSHTEESSVCAFTCTLADSLRVKLELASVVPIESIPASSFFPTRPEDLLVADFYKLGTLYQRIIVPGGLSIQYPLLDYYGKGFLVTLIDTGASLHLADYLGQISTVSIPCKLVQFEEIHFSKNVQFFEKIQTRIVENIHEYLSSLGEPSCAAWKLLDVCLVRVGPDMGANMLLDPVDVFNVENLEEVQPEAVPTKRPSMRHSASTFSIPGMASPKQLPVLGQAAPAPAPATFIYPKNFMANERSALAWISAIAVQSGVGVSLLGRPGRSFVGAVICLISLMFLWWSIYVFVRRFRQIRNKRENNDQVFYSMDLCTAFGATQVTILVIQTIVMIFM